MDKLFDPYHRWLGIPPKAQPANYYRLLGLEPFEADANVIRDAAEQRMAHVRTYQLGQYCELSQRILNELAAAKGCLLDPEEKARYDATLSKQPAASVTAKNHEPPPLQPRPAHATPASEPAATDRVRRRGLGLAMVAALVASQVWLSWMLYQQRRTAEAAAQQALQLAASEKAELDASRRENNAALKKAANKATRKEADRDAAKEELAKEKSARKQLEEEVSRLLKEADDRGKAEPKAPVAKDHDSRATEEAARKKAEEEAKADRETAEFGKQVRIFKGHVNDNNASFVTSVAFSADGKRVLTSSWGLGGVILWDAETGEQIRVLEIAAVFSPDGKQVLNGSWGKTTAILWNARTGEQVRAFDGDNVTANSVAFSPNGKLAVTGLSNNTAILWDVDTGQRSRVFEGDGYYVTSVAFSPDGKQVLTGSYDNAATLWDADSGEQLHVFRGHYHARFTSDGKPVFDPVASIAFSADSRRVLAGFSDRTAILWDAHSGKEVRAFQNSPRSPVFSPDGKLVLTGIDNVAVLCDADTGRRIRVFRGHVGSVNSVAFSPDGKRVLTGSYDGAAILWDAGTGARIRVFSGRSGSVCSVAFSPDGQRVLTGSGDGTAILWDASVAEPAGGATLERKGIN